VNENMHRYDSVKFVDTGRKGIAPVIAYYLKENGKHAILNQNVDCFNSQFNDKLLEIAVRRINDITSCNENRKNTEDKVYKRLRPKR